MMFFVEYLTLRGWFFSVLPQLLLDRVNLGGMGGRCYFIDASRLAILGARISAWITGVRVEQLAFRLVDVCDEAGLLIRLRIAYQDLAEVQTDAMTEPAFRALLQEEGAKDRLPTYLAKGIATISLSERGTLWRALLLVQVCAWKTRNEGREATEAVLFLERRPWLGAIRRYAARYGVTIVDIKPALNVSMFVRRVLTPKGVAWMRMLRDRLYHRWFGLVRKQKGIHRDGSPISNVSAMPFEQSARRLEPKGPWVAVEYHGQFNLRQPERYSDLFFWQQSELSGNDILVIFGFPQDPLDEKKWVELTENGMTAVVLYPGATTIPSVPLFTHHPRWRNQMSGGHPNNSRESLEGGWLRQQAQNYHVLREYWTKLFALENVKMYVTWYRYDAKHCAIADALRDLGGVTAIYQRAIQPDASAEITVDADIMFGYSPTDARVEQRSGSIIPYHVAVGYFGDHRFPMLRESGRAVGDRLRQHGAQYIVAFFDENSADDSRWHTGHEFQWVNYAFLFEKVLAEPWFGLVLKPKYPSTLRKRLGPVAELLERAIATGRCYLYEAGPLHGSNPPAVAALASDVAVHGHLCAATAGLEAALAGVPTLLLDREGWHTSRLYRLGVGRVVFTNWEELWDALIEHWNRPKGSAGFGDWTPMLEELDPFRDGRAAERMGTYIKWLIDGLKTGLDRETVMANAAERYCGMWGKDKVTAVNGQSWQPDPPGLNGGTQVSGPRMEGKSRTAARSY